MELKKFKVDYIFGTDFCYFLFSVEPRLNFFQLVILSFFFSSNFFIWNSRKPFLNAILESNGHSLRNKPLLWNKWVRAANVIFYHRDHLSRSVCSLPACKIVSLNAFLDTVKRLTQTSTMISTCNRTTFSNCNFQIVTQKLYADTKLCTFSGPSTSARESV